LFDPWRRKVPANLPILERDVVRLVVLDAAELVLLLDAGDSTAPAPAGAGSYQEVVSSPARAT